MAKSQPKPDTSLPPMSESEAIRRLEDFTRLVSDWIWEVDQDLNITFISDRVFEILGYHPQELIGRSIEEVLTFNAPEQKDLRYLLRRPFRDMPGTAKTKNGEICHISISGIPVFDNLTGDFSGLRGTADDVTARILAEKKLQESERQYRSLIEVQRTGLLVHRDFKIVFANATAVQMFGANSIEDLLGRTSLELTHPDYQETIKQRRRSLEQSQESQDFIELIHLRIDGSAFYSIDHAAPIIWENEPAVLVAVSDITATKNAEHAAEESEKRFKDFAETAADRFWETDIEHRFSYMSDPINDGHQLDSDALLGKKRWEAPVLNLESAEWQAHLKTIEAHQPFKNFHFQVQHDDGTIRYLISNGTPQFDDDGVFTGYRGTTDEETDQVLAKEKIADIQQQFFTAIENFSEGFALWDADKRFVYCNSYFRLTHASAQQHLLPGENYEDFIRAFGIASNSNVNDSVEEWIAQRIKEFDEQSATIELFRLGQWIQVRKHKLNNGSTMVLYADITELKEREQALRSSENHLQLITDAIPAMIAYHDLDLRYQFANKRFETLGLNPKEMIGKRIQDVFSPEMSAYVLPYIERTLQGESVTYDNFFPAENETGVYTQVSLIPDFDEADEVQGLFVLSFDITERKKAEAEIEKSKAALDAAQSIAKIGSWERNIATQSIYWSDEHFRIFGLVPGEHDLNLDFFINLVHPDDKDKMRKQLLKNVYEESHYSFDFRIIRPDGIECIIHGEGESIYDQQNNLIGTRGTSQDVTGRKRTEEALDQARREAEFANKAKSEFLSSMSHELRTPMNAVLGYAQLLLQTKKDPLQGRQTKQVNQILVSGQHLLKLINDILDLAKIESGHAAFELADVDLFETIGECISLITSLAERHNIDLKLLPPLASGQAVRADRTRVKQALLNLLSNAIKYNIPNGSVHIKYELTEEQMIRISVEDTGVGIPLERQSEIFEPFSRLGADQKGIEGTGIGLTITKQLVELMDGKIGFSSIFDEGSTFWIELPASPDVQSLESLPALSEQALSPISNALESTIYTLLYIEDDSSNLHLMEELIDSIPNLNLLSSVSAEDGLEIIKAHHPDIIIMDINLPGMNGLEAMALLKNDENTQNIPVIALSAAAMPHDLDVGKAAGFFNYLTKPFDISDVLENINEALELRNEITYDRSSD